MSYDIFQFPPIHQKSVWYCHIESLSISLSLSICTGLWKSAGFSWWICFQKLALGQVYSCVLFCYICVSFWVWTFVCHFGDQYSSLTLCVEEEQEEDWKIVVTQKFLYLWRMFREGKKYVNRRQVPFLLKTRWYFWKYIYIHVIFCGVISWMDRHLKKVNSFGFTVEKVIK